METYGEADMGGAGGAIGKPEKRVFTISAIGGGGGWVLRRCAWPGCLSDDEAVMNDEPVPGGVCGVSVYREPSC